MLFVSIVVSMEINRRHYFPSSPRTYIYPVDYRKHNGDVCPEEPETLYSATQCISMFLTADEVYLSKVC